MAKKGFKAENPNKRIAERTATEETEGFRRTGLHRQGPEPCAGERRG